MALTSTVASAFARQPSRISDVDCTRLKILVFVLLAAPAVQVQAASGDVLSKLCPTRAEYHLTTDEIAVVKAVLRHYRQAEWSSAKGRRERAFAHADYARHAVPSFASPQVLLLETVQHRTWFDAVLSVELERHAVPELGARTLLNSLRRDNATAYSLRLPQFPGVVRLNCRDAAALKYGLMQVAGDFANMATAVAISRPVFDDQHSLALILAVNDRDLRNLEFVLLEAGTAGGWEILWHVNAGPYAPRAEAAATAVALDDYDVFDAVLRQLQTGRFRGRKCIAVVNQTRTDDFPLPDELRGGYSATAAENRRLRSAVSLYIGSYAPTQPATLVQREAVETLRAGHGCGDAVSFSAPGYDADRQHAVVGLWLQTSKTEGVEFGIGWAVLTRTSRGWRVDRDAYQRSMLWPR